MTVEIKDSGQRQEFSTGARRDTQAGKGRFDLLPMHALALLAKHFEAGAYKYGDNNWRKGIPLARYLDSAFRHLTQFAAGNRDEPHLVSALWNIACLLETRHMIACKAFDEAEEAKLWHGITNEFQDDPYPAIFDHLRAAGKKPVDSPAPPARLGDFTKWLDRLNDPLRVIGGPTAPHTCTVPAQPKRWKAYLSGPMRGRPFLNFPAFDEVQQKLERNDPSLKGFIFNPAEVDRQHGLIPDSDAGKVKFTEEQCREFCTRDTEALLAMRAEEGDTLYLLPDWEASTGAVGEYMIASWLGLCVKSAVTLGPITKVNGDVLLSTVLKRITQCSDSRGVQITWGEEGRA